MSAPPILREAWETVRAARAFSVLFASISFIAVFVVVLLTGQAQAQRQSVLDEFSRPEYRTVMLTDTEGLGIIPWTLPDLLGSAEGIENAWALGPAFDVFNGAQPATGRVSAQAYAGPWTDGPLRLISGRPPRGPNEAVVDSVSAASLGLDETGGWAGDAIGRQWAVVGVYQTAHPQAPRSLLVPATDATPARVLAVTARTLPDVTPVAALARSLTNATTPTQLTVTGSADAETLQTQIANTVNRYGRTIVVSVMATSAISLTFLSVLMVHARRQEFGRRRALGASRGTIVSLVALQGALVVAVGASVGLVAAAVVAWLRFQVEPETGRLLVLGATAVAGSVLAQMPSAVTAAYRDPVSVLRTP